MRCASKEILYIGYYVSPNLFDDIVEKGINDMSAARQGLEAALLSEFAGIDDASVKALSYVPASPEIQIPEFSTLNGLQIRHIPIKKGSVASCIKAMWQFWKYLRNEIPDGSSVLMYAVNPVFVVPLFLARRQKRLTLTTICSEVPAYRRYKRSVAMHVKQSIQTFFNNRFDKYILLTKRMKDVVNVGSKPYMVMEGIASNLPEHPVTGERRNIVMYAGGLHPDNNIRLLIDACMKSEKVEECWICGSGPQEEELKRLSAKSTKIKFLGRKTHQEVLEMERQVKVLVNLRDPSNELTAYSFPSKIIEYLASGAMVISTRLKGIPDEYFEYLHSCRGNSADELASIFDEIMTMSPDKLSYRAVAALNFLQIDKSAKPQTEKILKFICQ